MRYFEDIKVGTTRAFGEYHVTKEEIVEFAEQYDPQPFHTDEDAATESAFGELVASGGTPPRYRCECWSIIISERTPEWVAAG